MATFWEPPALLTLAVLLGGSGAVIYHALRPALRGPLPVVTDERDEVWGVEDPPPPPKRPYVYPVDRQSVRAVAPVSDREPEPLALMRPSPTVAPANVIERATSALRTNPRLEDGTDGREDSFSAEEDEEPSLADLFRSRRRPRARRSDGQTEN